MKAFSKLRRNLAAQAPGNKACLQNLPAPSGMRSLVSVSRAQPGRSRSNSPASLRDERQRLRDAGEGDLVALVRVLPVDLQRQRGIST